LSKFPLFNKKNPSKIAWLTPWNTKCGIATYSEPVIKQMASNSLILAPKEDNLINSDGPNVRRCWLMGGAHGLDEASAHIINNEIDLIVIQFNYGFYDFSSLNDFVKMHSGRGKPIFMILHSTKDPDPTILNRKLFDLTSALKLSEIFVHTLADVKRLEDLGCCENINLIPLGVHEDKSSAKEIPYLDEKFIISTYGFALPNKGLLELLDAFYLIHKEDQKTHLLMVNATFPAQVSADLIGELKEKIKKWASRKM